MRHASEKNILQTLAALRVEDFERLRGEHPQLPSGPVPFITISRQAGSGGRTLANKLAERLNRRDGGELRWTVWDQELVERVATEHGLPAAKVEALEETRPSWLEEALGSLVVSAPPASEQAVYRRVAITIRALCEIGRVIVVGRGGNFITASLPGGIHLRLVAPLARRTEWIERSMNLSPQAAAKWVAEKDTARDAFFRRHFPQKTLAPESFTATFNVAAIPGDRLVESIVALVPFPAPVPAPEHARH